MMQRTILFSTIAGLLMLWVACKQGTNTNQGQAAPVFANQTDYICGMKVKADFTDTCHYNGKVYAFCSESCKEAFAAEPETYLSK